jgi:hypothetical protein
MPKFTYDKKMNDNIQLSEGVVRSPTAKLFSRNQNQLLVNKVHKNDRFAHSTGMANQITPRLMWFRTVTSTARKND